MDMESPTVAHNNLVAEYQGNYLCILYIVLTPNPIHNMFVCLCLDYNEYMGDIVELAWLYHLSF
jgi:hypothetical protein